MRRENNTRDGGLGHLEGQGGLDEQRQRPRDDKSEESHMASPVGRTADAAVEGRVGKIV